jgi:hypothetical protein
MEESMRPPWFTPLYSNWFIGNFIYEPFFGTGSIVDPSLFEFSEEDRHVFGTSESGAKKVLDEISQKTVEDMRGLLQQNAPKTVSNVPDVRTAVDALAYFYGKARGEGTDVLEFIQQYTHRPVATLLDLFGSTDLKYREEGGPFGKRLRLVEGTPGFFSRAISDYAELLGLLDNPDEEIPTVLGGKKERISRKIDPRPGRKKAVQAYVQSLNFHTDGLAVGLRG